MSPVFGGRCKCSFRHAPLPAMRLVLVLTVLLVAALPAVGGTQSSVTVAADARARPGGPIVASLNSGARITPGAAEGNETAVTVEGWVDASRLGARRDSFPASVSGRLTLRVRAQPAQNGTIIAVLQPGTGVHTLGRQGTWMRVRRKVWIPTAALRRSPATTSAASAAAPVTAAGEEPAAAAARPATPGGPAAGTTANALVGTGGARLHDLPVGRSIAGLSPGSSVEVIGRQFGWVRVRADGWVAEKDLITGEDNAPPGVSAADLRADPKGMRGRILQWEVEVMSLQVADPLRVELARDEPYLLARGPGAENVVLYLAVPPSLMETARSMAPLTKVRISARVRSARSEPAGTPILDLISIEKR